jgi:hypothetical protein
LITYAISKLELTDEIIGVIGPSPNFGEMVTTLHDLNKRLGAMANSSTRLREIYSDFLFQKAELLVGSPDARVTVLLELAKFHESCNKPKPWSEAIIAQMTAAAIVAEYLFRLGRIPQFFQSESPARQFSDACPSAAAEECPLELFEDRPGRKGGRRIPAIRGFCTTKFFNEYGLVYLLISAVDLCKRGNLFELAARIQALFSPIAESRRLWHLMEDQYQMASIMWSGIKSFFNTKDPPSLGSYFYVQFHDRKSYIYRQSSNLLLADFTERIRGMAALFSDGKQVMVTNEGGELHPSTFEEGKYYVLVKAVRQYFTASEREKRVTIFEQNHNVSQFYFDIPLMRGSNVTMENKSLRRYIFTVAHPLPYIIQRVNVPNHRVQVSTLAPIDANCEDLRDRIEKIEDASRRHDFHALPALLQGALLSQVNVGPIKMAEAFLADNNDEVKNQESRMTLRALFRRFIRANTQGVAIHRLRAKDDPSSVPLQESLEEGLNKLNSELQPYLS